MCKNSLTWEEYWESKLFDTNKYYNIAASFYRKYIIRECLNFFIKKFNTKDAFLLHAGCGSGEVDKEIVREFKVVALDISPTALRIYNKNNKRVYRTVSGNILDLPFDEEVFDCIYNLGVMEHFTEDQIIHILGEFKRVLKKDGKIILFWPPEYGLSVIFFKVLFFFTVKVFHKKLFLFPQEITRLKSKHHAKKLVEKAHLNLAVYYFGIMDIFTHVVLVLKK